jgi:phage shock protein PspC (stress-responsive transcriptional regulator)
MASGRLVRSTTDRKIAGVAAGVAHYLDLDVTAVRVAWILAVIFGGFGLLVYVIMWIVLPESETEGRSNAVDIAEERFARGEITAEELHAIKQDLR